jgi:predicted DNA-binding transcriptional regulator AlpA
MFLSALCCARIISEVGTRGMTPTAIPTITALDDQRPFVSADEAFAFLGIDRTTGYRAIHDNTFPVPVIRIGRIYRVPADRLRRLLDTADVVVDGADAERYSEPPTSDLPDHVSASRVGSRPTPARSPSPARPGRVTQRGDE